MDIILSIHSLNRWLIILVGIVALIKFATGWLGKGQFQQVDQRLMQVYTGLLDLQLLLGIILLIGLGIVRYQVEHAIIMVLAVVLAHLSRRWRAAEDIAKFRAYFILILVGLLLIVVGVTVLPKGWIL